MKSIIIVGGGASIREGVDKGLWDKIKGKEIIALNSSYKVMPYEPSIEMWVDKDFFLHDIDELQKLQMKGVKLVAKEHVKLKPFLDLIEIWPTSREAHNYFGKDSINKRMMYYGRQGLSGAFALCYCIGCGYDTIYALGYDFGSPNIEQKFTHWYQDSLLEKNIYSAGAGHPELYVAPNNPNVPISFMEDFKLFANEDTKIYNVSLISNLPYFPKISYDEFFERISNE